MLHNITFVLQETSVGNLTFERVLNQRSVHHPRVGEIVELEGFEPLLVREIRWIVDQDRLLVFCVVHEERS